MLERRMAGQLVNKHEVYHNGTTSGKFLGKWLYASIFVNMHRCEMPLKLWEENASLPQLFWEITNCDHKEREEAKRLSIPGGIELLFDKQKYFFGHCPLLNANASCYLFRKVRFQTLDHYLQTMLLQINWRQIVVNSFSGYMKLITETVKQQNWFACVTEKNSDDTGLNMWDGKTK